MAGEFSTNLPGEDAWTYNCDDNNDLLTSAVRTDATPSIGYTYTNAG